MIALRSRRLFLPFAVSLLVAASFTGSAVPASATPATSHANTTPPAPTLASDGYTLLPAPQQVQYSGDQFALGHGWHVSVGQSVDRNDVAIEALTSGLWQRDGIRLDDRGGSDKAIRLEVEPNAVAVGQAQAKDKAALAKQAYRLTVRPDAVDITANTSTGLFYGVEAFVQLVKQVHGQGWLPVTDIVDWPDVQQRNIFWDDSEHLDHLDVLKSAIRRTAFYKANGFVLKLDSHFQYKSAPAVVDPEAMSPAELQDLTNYGLRYHVDVIPYLDAPGHVAWILKHPEYANLREYPDSNYELCTTNPGTYKLLEGMYQDLLDANKGADWFVLSTDESYYVGKANNPQCDEASLASKLGSVGKVETQFLDQAAGYLHDRGRTVQFWGEYPLKPTDIPSLPKYLVNGETDGPSSDPIYAANGIRQTIYTWVQGTQLMFPDYYNDLTSAQMVHPINSSPRIPGLKSDIQNDSSRGQSDLIGVFVAAWGDSGLHPETFWMGFITGASWAWNPANPSPEEAANSFYHLFYGNGTVDMPRLYQLMSEQAEFYQTSWETGPSTARKGIWGNSKGQFIPRRPASDQSVPLPGVPQAGSLQLNYDWSANNATRLQLVQQELANNTELLSLIKKNEQSVQFGQNNLKVYESIANLERQDLQLLEEFGSINNDLQTAQNAAAADRKGEAVVALDRALATAQVIKQKRNAALHNAVDVWYKSWFPRVAEANGRTLLHEVDDVKDHLPERTVDMSYLVYRQLLLPMGGWYDQVQTVRNDYAQANGLPTRSTAFNWGDSR